MRRFKLQVQTSIDGFMAGPDDTPMGMSVAFTADVYASMDAVTKSVDCIVLGRRTAEGFIPAWASRPESEPEALVDWINATPKVVISNSLTSSPWDNAVVAGGDLAETVNDLKSQPGGDLITYGGFTLVQALTANDLLDDVHLFVNPAAIGDGMPVFRKDGGTHRFQLVEARPFDCGIVELHYRSMA